MTALDDAPRTSKPLHPGGGFAVASWLRHPAARGVLGASSTLAPLLALAVLAEGTDPRAGGSPLTAAGAGAVLWLAALGGGIQTPSAVVTLVPLTLTALIIAALTVSLRSVIVDAADGVARPWRGDSLVARPVAVAVAWWWLGYAGMVAIATALTTAAPASPAYVRFAIPLLIVPALAVTWRLAKDASAGIVDLGPALTLEALPARFALPLRRVLPVAVRGAGLLLLVGAVPVLLAVVLGYERVSLATAALGVQGAGVGLLWAAQLAFAPNLALWGLSFLSGPGFSVTSDVTVSWSGVGEGIVPLVPVFAAIPAQAHFGWWVRLGALLPVQVGVWLGHRCLQRMPRLSAARAKLTTAALAAVVTGLLVGVLALAAGSALGAHRLSGVGAPVGWLVVAVTLLLLLGATARVLWDAWRRRR